MITWMQRHKKYLIITIWISTIAFVGAGFVGWGQYNYGDKAGAVAKVGNIEITMGTLQKSYSRLYSQYNQMFQGQFDEEKAKQFGLQRQALNQLTNQALLLNLAQAYDLRISDADLLAELMKQEHFFKDGVFNKSIYKETLSSNNLSLKEYETDLKKQMLIQKVLKLLPIHPNKDELKISTTIANIADKIEYKLLTDSNITVDTSDERLKPFWEQRQRDFMSEVSYEVKYIKQAKVMNIHEEGKIASYYDANKNHFKNEDGKILNFEDAKEKVVDELNAKDTKEMALRAYIAYKKQKLSSDVVIHTATISQKNNPFTQEILEKIQALTITSPYLKPMSIDGEYFTFELIKVNPSKTKSFLNAKDDVKELFIKNETTKQLRASAQKSLETFKGTISDFLTRKDFDKIADMPAEDANDFIAQLFISKQKKGIIYLRSGNIVLYSILEQKILNNSLESEENSIEKLKSAMFNEGLIKELQNLYTTEIFIEGLSF
ncbi:peptidylprolyl isomerase [Sulfurimonas sp. SAG-AH-194-I05]|nr:peptidylprolyl isomerase [Sulfurimonas sp. SAG-AH-194-I05]MDF1874676.1 peptidylprolyl isomerase [Sulfurimonas sp. SAG-AH-194-I05]